MATRLPRPERQLRQTLAANVRRLREARGLSLHDAGERSGMHWRHWQKVEAGDVNATLHTLSRLAVALEVAPRDLFA